MSLLAAFLVSLAPTFAIVASYLLSRKGTREVAKTLAVNDEKLEGIHILVNQRMTDALARIEGLERALGIAADAPIPQDTPGRPAA